MKRLPYILLALLVLAAASLLTLTSQEPTGHTTAQAGTVTQLHITPTTPWGGLYGNLGKHGAVKATVTRAEITKQDLYHHNESCQKTTLVASNNPQKLADIQPITPSNADAILNNNPSSPFSITRMYTQEETYELDGRAVTLWSTQTTGTLGNYVQGIAKAGTQIVYVAQTKRIGRAYNGANATYQILLPAGEWVFATDKGQACNDLNEYIHENETKTQPARLQATIPTRVCTAKQNTLYAATGPERTLCRPSDVPAGCKPKADIHARITHAGELIHETTTDETGTIDFTPEHETTYTITLSGDGERTTKRFRTQRCLEYSVPTNTYDDSRTQTRSDVQASPLYFNQPQRQEPSQPSKSDAAYMLVLLLTISTLLASAIIYARLHADDNIYVLELRIAWERLKQLLR